MSKIFISYRRDDSRSVTGRIHDRLKKNLRGSSMFKDVSSIPVGANFLDYTNDKLSKSDIFLPIIGNTWASSLLERSNDEHDYVRIEVEQALASEVTIIPVLVKGAKMPKINEVPDSIKAICLKNAIHVRPDPDFDNDVLKLVSVLEHEKLQRTTPFNRFLQKIRKNKTLRNGLFVIMALLLIYLIKVNFLSGSGCSDNKVTGVVANFSETTVDPFTNTIMTIMEDSLDQDYVNLRTGEYLSRNTNRYKDELQNKYFSKCDTRGLHVNGYREAESKISNVYSTLVNFPVNIPPYLQDSLTFTFPDSINFNTDEDAGFIARVMSLILRATYQESDKLIKESYQIQKDYELTAKSESKNKGSSALGTIYFVRAHAYAIDGNDKRAKQFYKKASQYGDKEIERVSVLNKQKSDRVAEIMWNDPDLKLLRAANIISHQKIESGFEKFLREVEKAIKSLFNKLGIG